MRTGPHPYPICANLKELNAANFAHNKHRHSQLRSKTLCTGFIAKKVRPQKKLDLLAELVGVTGFEPATSTSRT